MVRPQRGVGRPAGVVQPRLAFTLRVSLGHGMLMLLTSACPAFSPSPLCPVLIVSAVFPLRTPNSPRQSPRQSTGWQWCKGGCGMRLNGQCAPVGLMGWADNGPTARGAPCAWTTRQWLVPGAQCATCLTQARDSISVNSPGILTLLAWCVTTREANREPCLGVQQLPCACDIHSRI